MRRKHFLALAAVIVSLLVCHFGGVFAFFNSWAFDQLVKVGPRRTISSDIVAIRVWPHDDWEALIEKVQPLEYKSLSLLMLNHSGALTSFVFSPKGEDVRQYKSDVRPPETLTWRGPEDTNALQSRLEASLDRTVYIEDRVVLDFAHDTTEIPMYEANEILQSDFDLESLRNKVVIIGDHFSSHTRFFPTPIHSGRDSLTTLSREILLADAELSGGWVRAMPTTLPLVLAVMIIAALLISYITNPTLPFKRLTAVLIFFVMSANFFLLKVAHVWCPVAEILISIFATGMIFYAASAHEWKRRLDRVIGHILTPPLCGTLVYGQKLELKYRTDGVDRFFRKKGVKDVASLRLKEMVEAFTKRPADEIDKTLEKATMRRQELTVRTEENDQYLMTIAPLDKKLFSTPDLLVSIKEVIPENKVEMEADLSPEKQAHHKDQAIGQN